jgi:flavin-dependent dehydrogenase
VLSRQLGGRIQRVDRLVACISQYAVVGAKQLTLVEATPQGYLYSAPVPSERLVVAQLTDADLAPGATLARELVARIAAAPHTRARIGNATPLGTPQLYPACSQRMLPGAKRGRWLAVGDAAFAVDPLSGSGYLRAIQRGCSGAEALSRALAGDAAALDRHEQAVHADFDRYLAQRSEVYQQETRFPDAPFWARRRPELARAG